MELPGEWGEDEMQIIWILQGFLSWLLVRHIIKCEALFTWLNIFGHRHYFLPSVLKYDFRICMGYTGTKFKDTKAIEWKVCISPDFLLVVPLPAPITVTCYLYSPPECCLCVCVLNINIRHFPCLVLYIEMPLCLFLFHSYIVFHCIDFLKFI